MKSLLKTLLLTCIMLLAGCSSKTVKVEDALGYKDVRGTLTRADISLVRRGTHILSCTDGTKYFVESATENITKYEGEKVHITGTAMANSLRNNLPILVIEHIEKEQEGSEKHQWEIPALGLRITTPESWQASIEGDKATFTIQWNGGIACTVERTKERKMPTGDIVYIDDHIAARTQSVTEEITTYILQSSDGNIHVRCHNRIPSTQTGGTLILENEEIQKIVQSIKFMRAKDANVPTETGSVMHCGGYNGTQCGPGYFCNVTNQETRGGDCVRLQKKAGQ